MEGVCSLCPQGTYQDQEGRDFCHKCPRGSSLNGASSVNQCKCVSHGHWSSISTTALLVACSKSPAHVSKLLSLCIDLLQVWQIARGGDCAVQRMVTSYQHSLTSCLAGGCVSAVRGWSLTGPIATKLLLMMSAQVKAQHPIREYFLTEFKTVWKMWEKSGIINNIRLESHVGFLWKKSDFGWEHMNKPDICVCLCACVSFQKVSGCFWIRCNCQRWWRWSLANADWWPQHLSPW